MPADNRPPRYVVPYTDDGGFPEVYVWFPGITETRDDTGRWSGQPTAYQEALDWDQALKKVDGIMKHEAKLVREYRARWREATPDMAVQPRRD